MTKNDIYRRHSKALNHIKNLRKPSIKILNEVLRFNSLITKSHFNLCKFIVDNSVTLNFP
jgi:hypothetical protein